MLCKAYTIVSSIGEMATCGRLALLLLQWRLRYEFAERAQEDPSAVGLEAAGRSEDHQVNCVRVAVCVSIWGGATMAIRDNATIPTRPDTIPHLERAPLEEAKSLTTRNREFLCCCVRSENRTVDCSIAQNPKRKKVASVRTERHFKIPRVLKRISCLLECSQQNIRGCPHCPARGSGC